MSSICVFCCTRIKSGNCDNRKGSFSEEIKRFFKVTQSHFNVNASNIFEEEGCHLLDKACFKCEQSLKLVCQLYHNMECIRLKMEWEFGELIRNAEVVGRTPSKIKWLRKNQSANDFQRLANFRQDLILKGNQSLSRSTPNVILHRTENQSGGFPIGTNDDFDPFPKFTNSDDIDNTSDLYNMDNETGDHNDENEQRSPANPAPVINDLNNTDDKMEDNSEPPTKKHINCPHCPIKFSHRNTYKRHHIKNHPEFPPPKPKIPSVPRANKFVMPIILPVFNEDHHDSSKPEQDLTNIKDDNQMEDKPPIKKCPKCPNCPKKFSSEGTLLHHLARGRHHQIPHMRHRKSSSSSKKSAKKSNLQPIREICPICQRSLQQYSLKKHYNRNHSIEGIDPQNVYKCDSTNCPAYFRTLVQLQGHKREVHDNNDNIHKTTCPICGRICSEIANLKTHMKTQHDDENPDLPFCCDVDPKCPKRFANEAILKWHRKYYYHWKKERSVKTFKCSDCQKEIQGAGAFKKHQEKHQRPEAPWICEICGAAFKKKSILKTHEFFHVDPDKWAFQCEECGKKCATKHRLREHMNVHLDGKLYSCEACGKGYKCRQKLRNHVNKFHVEEGFQDIPRKTAKAKLISRRMAT